MKRLILVFTLALHASLCAAQDPLFSQYYHAPLYLNPGFTGTTAGHRMALNHRLQWPSLPQAYTTYAVSYDAYAQRINSGIGVLIMTDKMGSANWNNTTANVLYSYKVRLTSELVFSPGLSFGYGTSGLDRSRLRLADAMEYPGGSIDPVLSDIHGQDYFDVSSGFVLYNKRMWIGGSFMHLNQPDISILSDESRLGMKTSVHGGLRLETGSQLRPGRPVYFTPSFVYRTQGQQFSQLDLGANFHVDPVSVGAWYRGIPMGKGSDGHEALILFFGLYLKNLTAGYSYDFTVSRLHNASGGAHELSLTYEIKNKRKVKRQGLIPCPAFYNH